MKTILIPTDFSLSSLQCIPDLCAGHPDKEINLVFLHMFNLSDSMGDLLMLSRRSKEYTYVSDDFYIQCEELKREVPQVAAIRIEFFYGSTVSMFKNFIEDQEISHILHPDFCSCQKLNKNSIDPASLISRSNVPTLQVVRQPKHEPVQVSLHVPELEESLLAESMA